MPVITLDDQQAKELINHLATLSDLLTARHKEEHSGVAQFLLLSAVQEVDRLWVEIREQVEQTTASEPTYEPIPMPEA